MGTDHFEILGYKGKIVVDDSKPFNEECDTKPKFIPRFLHEERLDLEYDSRNLWRNDIPKDVDVNLLVMYVAEYIPIENIDKLNKGMKKLFKLFVPKRMNTNDISNIDAMFTLKNTVLVT